MSDQSRRDVLHLAAGGSASVVAGIGSAAAQGTATPASRIIDVNMHWLPETMFSDRQMLASFMEAIPRHHRVAIKEQQIPNKTNRQIIIEEPPGYDVLNYVEGEYHATFQLAAMDQAKVDTAIFRLPCWQEWLDLEMCRKVNDGVAEHVKRHPGRFRALVVVPPWGSADSLKEIEHSMARPEFCGVQLVAHYGELYLDDVAFRPLLKFLNDQRIPVVVHHTPLPVEYNSIITYANQRRQYGRCVAQGTAVGREIFSPLFDELPDLRLVHSMLGGGFFAFADMLAPRFPRTDTVERFEDQSARIRKHLTDNIYFDLSGAPQWGKAQLECAVNVFGADHIMLGGSFPLRKDWFQNGREAINVLDIPAADKALILGGNAARMFRL